MSLDLNDHRLTRLEEMLDELKASVEELKKSVAQVKESLAVYRGVVKFAVALASAVGALAALLVDWMR